MQFGGVHRGVVDDWRGAIEQQHEAGDRADRIDQCLARLVGRAGTVGQTAESQRGGGRVGTVFIHADRRQCPRRPHRRVVHRRDAVAQHDRSRTVDCRGARGGHVHRAARRQRRTARFNQRRRQRSRCPEEVGRRHEPQLVARQDDPRRAGADAAYGRPGGAVVVFPGPLDARTVDRDGHRVQGVDVTRVRRIREVPAEQTRDRVARRTRRVFRHRSQGRSARGHRRVVHRGDRDSDRVGVR